MPNFNCVFSHADGSFLCAPCVQENADPSEFDPTRFDDELEEAPACIVCGKLHSYMIVRNLDRIADSLEKIGDELEKIRDAPR